MKYLQVHVQCTVQYSTVQYIVDCIVDVQVCNFNGKITQQSSNKIQQKILCKAGSLSHGQI